MKIGDRVTYSDEDVDEPSIAGTIVEPTAEELEHAKTYEYPVGPDQGDVMVEWDDDESRSWEDPSDLTLLTPRAEQ